MKKFLIQSAILLVLAITNLSVFAQQEDSLKKQSTPTDLKQRQTAFYGKKLSLNQELAAKVTEIQSEFKSEIIALNSDSKLSEDAKRAKVDKLVVEKINKLRLILTKDQLSLLLPATELEKVVGHSSLKK